VRDKFNAQLLSGRVVYDVTENWDLGLMAAAQFGQRGARQTAYGVEAGYLLRQNLWLSAGFNATGFAGDADLAGYEYTRSGAYLRLRFKFDENLFKSGDREVNRSLDR
jgi:murein tripeptide amidase MpaA